MNNMQKTAFEETFSSTIECWEKVPVIVNGIESYNFYRANLASHINNVNKR